MKIRVPYTAGNFWLAKEFLASEERSYSLALGNNILI
jgi:hypothetical protein